MSTKNRDALSPDEIYCLDAQEGLKRLPDATVDCVVTSPPYWATRDYDLPMSSWPDGSRSALGLETNFEDYIEHLCGVFDEIRRVLKPTGTVWVNLGDTYHNATKWTRLDESPQTIAGGNNRGFKTGRRMDQGLPEKCLTLVPGRFAIEMIRRGWILRNDIVWHKPNHMPSSVKDRLTCSWEHLFLFVKGPKYYFDLDAVRVPHRSVGAKLVRPGKHARKRPSPHIIGVRQCPNLGDPQAAHPLGKNPADYWSMSSETRTLGAVIGERGAVKVPGGAGWTGHMPGGMARIVRELDPRWLSPNGKNPSDVWPIGTQPSSLGHFAMFPEKLVERPILAGCPAKVCKRCGTPRLTRRVFRYPEPARDSLKTGDVPARTAKESVRMILGCKCKHGFEPGIVLDPFMGTGTTAVVAKKLGRRFIGFELSAQYVKVARKRLEHTEFGSCLKKAPPLGTAD